MATNSRSGNGKRQLPHSDSGAVQKKTLKFTEKQFYKLESFHDKLDLAKKDALINELEAKLKKQSIRIHNLELGMIELKQSHFNNRVKKIEAERDLYRNEIAKELGVKTLDDYIIDTETLELFPESELTGKA